MTTTEEKPEDIKNQRDALLTIIQSSQRIAKEHEQAIALLLLAGHVDQERVDQAFALARGGEK